MQIGTLKLYKGISGTIEFQNGNGSRYYGKFVVNGSTINYAANTVGDLYEEFHKAVDNCLGS